MRRRESRDGNGLGLALLVGLTVLAALAVAYLLTTGRVPMILARLTYRTQ